MKKLFQDFFASDDTLVKDVIYLFADELGKVEKEPERRVLRTFYDTFDWRLHLAGYSLARGNRPASGYCELRKLGAGELILRAPQSDGRFFWEFPPGPLRDLLSEHIGIRGLLPVVKLCGQVQQCCIRDKRGKIVLGISRELFAACPLKGDAQFGLKPRLRFEGVRGYDDALNLALSIANRFSLVRAQENILDEALGTIGLSVEKYQPKPTIPLDPKMPAIAAMSAILLHLLQVMRTNLPGTTLDLDSEFLHDFRVAVRRTRSALGQLKGIFPESSIAPFREGFKWLGGITGPTRDLDVYLLKFPDYCRQLPESTRPDLKPLQEFLHNRQLREQKILAAHLQSSRLRALLDDWEKYLETFPDPGNLPPAANLPIGELASAKIHKTGEKFIRQGKAIGNHSPVESLHQLRITGKKLRYLLEFFQTLYSPKPMARLVKEMKKMQDFLGDFQDLAVQQRHLRRFGDNMKNEGDVPAATLLAMGRLMEDLARRQHAMRLDFCDRFREFSEGEAGRLFDQLFNPPQETST